MQLTNADRRVLLDSFRTLAADWAGEPADLTAWATEWTASLDPSFGFETALARDVFVLCETLRKNTNPEATRLACGGLAYLYRNNYEDPVPLGPLGLLDDAFVAGYAAHAVRDQTGEAVCYCPPRLGPDEQARAETMFIKLLDRPEEQDAGLPELAEAALLELGQLLESGLFRRLRMNVRFLAHVLNDRKRSKDHRQIARAALHYVAEDNDAIPDSLGLIGFLDDYFVADLAVGRIDPGQLPWMNLIDAAVGVWPFLNMVTFGDGRKGMPASEFLVVNAALVCPALRGTESHPLTHLILPRTGPLPLLLGFLASLGELMSARGQVGSTVPYEVGQKVLVDGSATRTFAGCKSVGGRLMFGLEKTRRERGIELRSSEWWPIEHLDRITPADNKKTARGKISFAGRQNEPLGPLDYLFLSAEPVTVSAELPQVVVVTPAGTARKVAASISLFGHSLCDTLPMGHLTSSEDICYWSGKFGTTRPAVLVVPDLDRACEYVEGEGKGVALTVVDASGHNAARLASLARLQGMGARLLVAVSQADADDVLDDGADQLIWEWDPTDFESVQTAEAPPGLDSDPVLTYERGVFRSESAAAEIVRVDSPEAEAAYRTVSALRRLVEARGEEAPQELEDALGRSFGLLTRLLRCPFHLASHPRLRADLADWLKALTVSDRAGVFLSGEETAAIADAGRDLTKLFDVLCESNPKAAALSSLRTSRPDLVVVCGDTELLDGADALGARSISSALHLTDDCCEVGHAVAGWFGRGTMNRLLRPPFATPLHLLLYGPESSWEGAFTRHVRVGSAARRGATERGRLFPGLGKWPGRHADTPVEVHGDASGTSDVSLDAVEAYLLSGRRNRLTALARPSSGEEAVEARLFTFDGGHAFLTDDYQAKLATHLLDDTTQSEDAELELVPARRLRRGDVILFLRGSDRDVIRQVADQLLPTGERDRAGLWRQALLQYRQQQDCTVETVWQRLREHGCPLSHAAIANWFSSENIISPINVSREVGAILELTDDANLRSGFDACRTAITHVRGAHLRASNLLAKRVVERAVTGLRSAVHGGGAVDLGEGIVLARVTAMDDTPVMVKASLVNRLLEDSPWPA